MVTGERHVPHGSDWSSIREAGTSGQDRNPTDLVWKRAGMDSVSKGMVTRRHVDQAYVGYWLAQTGTGSGTGSVDTDRSSLLTNPAESTILPPRKTDIRNEVTAPAPSIFWSRIEQVPTACAGGSGIAQEAKAWRKAPGYADVGTTWPMVEVQVGVHMV